MSQPRYHDGGRGRDANMPREIPALGWKDIFYRIKREMREDRVGFIAAGVAFYMLMGMIPAIGALVAIYGLVSDPAAVESQLTVLRGLMPREALELIGDELKRITSDGQAAGVAAAIGLILALWGGAKAVDALITAMNVAYDEDDSRSFFRRKLVSLALTTGAIFFVILAVGLLIAGPFVLGLIGLGPFAATLLSVLRWPFLCVAGMLWLAVLYRYAPARTSPKWRWVTWGSFIATIVWLVGSMLFSLYTANFADFNKSYGSFGALILLLTWFYLSAYAMMLGAEINSEIEHQTARDSTVGEEQPMGQRGAYVADTLGRSKPE